MLEFYNLRLVLTTGMSGLCSLHKREDQSSDPQYAQKRLDAVCAPIIPAQGTKGQSISGALLASHSSQWVSLKVSERFRLKEQIVEAFDTHTYTHTHTYFCI